jgi:predicted AAA+ superfamily ATPase
MTGQVCIIVGARGNGKSHFTKKMIRDVHTDRLWVYDVQGEYFNDDEPLPDIDDFLAAMEGKMETVQIYEEATVFFSNRGSNKVMRKILVGARHDRNLIVLIFHSIRSIPYYIYYLID